MIGFADGAKKYLSKSMAKSAIRAISYLWTEMAKRKDIQLLRFLKDECSNFDKTHKECFFGFLGI